MLNLRNPGVWTHYLCLLFRFTEFLEPFERVIQPEELWLYKNPLVESDHIPKRVMFAISFLTPLAVIFVVKIIQRTDKTEIKEYISPVICNHAFATGVDLDHRPRPDYFHRCFPDGQLNAKMLCTGEPDLVSEGRKSFPSSHSSFAFSGLGFTSFYLAGKLQCFTAAGRGRSWRLCAMILPLYSAMMIALSRTCDYKHHWQASSIFGYEATSFPYQHLAIICHSSSHRFTSQALSGWKRADKHFSPEIFDWFQAQALAGPLKDIHRVVY
uniref:Phospholipid phosphatase 4 n=1 Tax=Cyprinus carpio TaxID=7962 RepID=A0A8C1IRM2_CYPCA